MFRIFGEKLACLKRAVRRAGDHIGESTATIDPEIPARVVKYVRRHTAQPAIRGGKREGHRASLIFRKVILIFRRCEARKKVLISAYVDLG